MKISLFAVWTLSVSLICNHAALVHTDETASTNRIKNLYIDFRVCSRNLIIKKKKPMNIKLKK